MLVAVGLDAFYMFLISDDTHMCVNIDALAAPVVPIPLLVHQAKRKTSGWLDSLPEVNCKLATSDG